MNEYIHKKHIIWISYLTVVDMEKRLAPRFWRTKEMHLSASIPALCWLNRYELAVVMRDIYAATRCEWGRAWRWDLESTKSANLHPCARLHIFIDVFICSEPFTSMNYCMWVGDACGQIRKWQ